MKIALFLISLFVFAVPVSVYAENQVFIPEIMLSGLEYFGTIITSDYEGLVTLSSSDSNIVKVAASLYFDGDEKQKMFKITPLNDGDVTISADFGDEQISANINVYFPTTPQNALELILPSEYTSVSNVVGYVYLLEFGNTKIATEDIDVVLTSKGNIQHPTKITILKGTTGASFDISVNGSSEIIASSDSFESDTETIQLIPRKISVVIDAPHIVSANSLVYAVASFVENDMHYIPTQLRSAIISSSNPEIVSINPTNTSIDQNKTIYFNQDGIALIKLYAKNPGIARIDIHVSGFGSSTTEIFVGPTLVESGTVNVNGTSSTQIEIIEGSTKQNANTVLGWVFPKINSGNVYLFAGSYLSIDDTSLDVGADSIEISSEATEYHPIIGQKSLHITSNGATHDDIINVGSNEMPSNLGYVKISSPVGNFDFTVSSPDILNSYTEQITFGSPSHHSYTVSVIPLPVIHGYFQDVALIGISDNYTLINPHRMGQNTQFTTTSKAIKIKQSIDFFDFGSNIAVISGDVKSGGTLDVSVSDIGDASGEIYLSKPNTESHFIRIFAPSSTYFEEQFAAYAFIVNSNGVPIDQVTPKVSGMCQNSKDDNMFVCNGRGTIFYFSEFASVQEDVNLIYHKFDGIQIEKVSKLNAGQSKTISINGIDSDVEITIYTDIPNHITDYSDIIFEPDMTGIFDVKVVLEKKGFTTKVLDFSITVSDDIMITVTANDNTNDIAVDVLVDGEFTKQTPFVINHERKTVTLEFTENKMSDVRNIIFNNLMVDYLQITQNKVTLDTLDHFTYGAEVSVVAQYDPKLVVSTIDISEIKTTTHNIGETVTVLPANDKPVFALLVYEKFDGWSSDDAQIDTAKDGTATFEINQNTILTPTYHTDYTNAGILIAVILTVALVSLQRKNNKFMFMVFADTLLRRNNDEYEEYEEEGSYESDAGIEDDNSDIAETATTIASETQDEPKDTINEQEPDDAPPESQENGGDKNSKKTILHELGKSLFKV